MKDCREQASVCYTYMVSNNDIISINTLSKKVQYLVDDIHGIS